MLATTAAGMGIRVFGYPIIRPWASSGDFQRADGRGPTLGPPDVTVWIDRDQVRSQIRLAGRMSIRNEAGKESNLPDTFVRSLDTFVTRFPPDASLH